MAPVTLVEWHPRQPDQEVDARLARMLLGPATEPDEPATASDGD
jgi:hypothetical protein